MSRWHHHDISDQMQDTGNEAGIPTIRQMIPELERSALIPDWNSKSVHLAIHEGPVNWIECEA